MSGAEIDGLEVQPSARPADDARQHARSSACSALSRLAPCRLPAPGLVEYQRISGRTEVPWVRSGFSAPVR